MLRQCPFDPVHVVQAYRYQRHILRCRKQNPEKAVDFRQCKFNAMHFFHKDKILQHEEECVDKARIERNRKIAAGKEFIFRVTSENVRKFLRDSRKGQKCQKMTLRKFWNPDNFLTFWYS